MGKQKTAYHYSTDLQSRLLHIEEELEKLTKEPNTGMTVQAFDDYRFERLTHFTNYLVKIMLAHLCNNER